MVRRFQYRPAEELYHTTLDPWNLHNLADDPNHQSIKDSHAKALKAWMEAQGDEGQATELQALDRQWKRASLNQSQGK
jgi:uncharacterized sulfatase